MTGLPQGWVAAQFGDLFDFKGGSQPPKETFFSEPAADRVRLLQIRDFGSDDKAVYIKDEPKWPKCSEMDIMVGRYGASVGKILTGKAGAYNVALIRWIFDDEKLEREWVRRLLQSDIFQVPLQKISRSAQNGFNKEDIARLPLALPPLPEQRRIVRKLDILSARSTTARTHLTAIEKLVERMRGAVLSQALTGRLVASQLDCGEPVELGRFITGIEQGWSPKCDNEQELDPTKWAVLTTTAVQAIDFDCTENKRLPDSLSPRPHLEVEVGDVLMTRAGPRVRCAVCCYVAETAPRRIFSDKIYRIRLDKSVEPEFFAMMMNAPEMVRALDAIKSGGSESGLNLTQDRLKSLAINIWDRPTQVEVVADIKRQFAKIDRLAAEAAKALKLLGHLDQRILAKAFAGDLVPQDPTDEPAETLLARIREARTTTPKGKRGRKSGVS